MHDSLKYRVVPIVTVLVLVLGLGACGSSSSSAPPTTTLPPAQAWAAQVCGALDTWTTGMSEMASSSPSTATGNLMAGLEATVQQAVDLTKQLSDSLKAAGAPKTESGQQIQTQLDTLSASINDRVTAVKTEVDNLQSVQSLSDLSQTVSGIVANLQGIVTDTKDALGQLEGADPSGELKAAVDATPACQQFTKGSTATTTKAG